MIQNDAEDTANAVPVTSMVSPGLDPKDPAAIEAMNNSLRLRGRDVLRAGVMGAAAGSQVGQQAGDPRSAFIQGMAAGMGATDTVFRERKQELQTAADMVPFGSAYPEIVNSNPAYAIFKGLPTKLALQAIQQIGIDAAKIQAEGIESRKTEYIKNRIDSESAKGYASLYQKATGKSIDPEILIGLNESEVKEFINAGGVDTSKIFSDERQLREEFTNQVKAENFSTVRDQYFNLSDSSKKGTAAGDMKMIFSYMKMLDPNSIVRESEYASAQNAAGIPSRAIVAYNKAIDGQSLSPQQRAEFLAEARDIWKRKTSTFKSTVDTYRTLAKNSGFDPNRVVTNIGNVLSYTDPNDSKYIPIEKISTTATPSPQYKVGDTFAETVNGWTSTYKVVEVNGKLGRKRISVVEDKE